MAGETWDVNATALQNLNKMAGVPNTGYMPLQSNLNGTTNVSWDPNLSNLQNMQNAGLDTAGVVTPEMSLGQKFGVGLGALQTLGGLYLGYQQMQLGKKSLAENIRAFNANYNAQRDLTNAAMYDRNVRRNLELGQTMPEAQTTAQSYVDARGIKALSDKAG